MEQDKYYNHLGFPWDQNGDSSSVARLPFCLKGGKQVGIEGIKKKV